MDIILTQTHIKVPALGYSELTRTNELEKHLDEVTEFLSEMGHDVTQISTSENNTFMYEIYSLITKRIILTGTYFECKEKWQELAEQFESSFNGIPYILRYSQGIK